MRRIIQLLLVLCLLSLAIPVAFAAAPDLRQTPDFYDPARQREIEILKQKIDDMIEAEEIQAASSTYRVAYPIIDSGQCNVPLRQQTTGYYCGPASVQMVLAYFNYSVSQTTLANAMSTTSSGGTYVYQIRNCLNSYLGSGTYSYVMTSEVAFVNGLKYSIGRNHPVVCHVQTHYLPVYGGVYSGHYVVATGYNYVQYSANAADDVRTVDYNDPHYNNTYYGKHTCSINDMTQAIMNQSTYYIMG